MTDIVPIENITEKIFLIRGHCQSSAVAYADNVMLDRDLADLYGVETKQLKRAVRRNIDRFPSDFMFELTNGELENLRSPVCQSSGCLVT